MKPKSERLAAGRLVLKPLEDRDKAALLRMVSDERITRAYMLPDFRSKAEADAFFARLQALSASDARFVYGIFLEGDLIGFLNDCEADETGMELGYFIDPAHWGRGYATEALRASIGELFRMGYTRVTAGYFEENPASRRVMEKCGMRPLPQSTVISYRGADHRCLYYGIDRT